MSEIKENDLIKFKSIHSDVVWYVKVNRFYPLNDGGNGFEYTYLGGFGNGSQPLSSIDKVKHFLNIKEMQKDIDNDLQNIFQ